MRVVSFFSGIGGFEIGLERAGMTVVAQSEIDPYCCKVLAKHWPDVPNLGDIRELEPKDIPEADLWCGGFPCQDISHAGRRAGISGARSSLWWEWFRLLRDVRPRWLLVEQSPSLAARGIDEVLGSLASMGFDAEWACIPASAVGAHHLRARLWILAHTMRERNGLPEESVFSGWDCPVNSDRWSGEPEIRRVADGVPRRVDRLRALGNAVVPQVVEWIGRRILECATTTKMS